MIANARMYSVDTESRELWRSLFLRAADNAGIPLEVINHGAPKPIADLWELPDLGAVFMCGLPLSRSTKPREIVAAPVPSPAAFGGQPRYWSEFVVRADSNFATLQDTFGTRLALTVLESQSGYAAPLTHLKALADATPLYLEVVAPRISPLGALEAVVTGAADVAPLDAYAFYLLKVFRPELTQQVRVVARTAPTPIPPLVSSSLDVVELRTAFTKLHLDAEAKPIMDKLLLTKFVSQPLETYDILRINYDIVTAFWRTRPLAHHIHPAFVI